MTTMPRTPTSMHAVAVAIIIAGALLRLVRLDEVPNFNADEGEYALMSLSLLEGVWPSNFIAPTGRPLIGPVLWVGHLLWASLTDDAGPATIFWLRLPNAALGIAALMLWWRWRRSFVQSDGAALLGLALLATSISEVLGARMAWDPGAYGVVCLCWLRCARAHQWMGVVVIGALAMMVHPLMVCLLPVLVAHGADRSGNDHRWRRAQQVLWLAVGAMVVIAVLRDKAWLTSMPMRLTALPGYWSVVITGDQQWHEALQMMDYDPSFSYALALLLLLSTLVWHRHHAVAMVAAMLLLSSFTGVFVLNWRYGSMFVVPIIIASTMAIDRLWHRPRFVVTAVAIAVAAGQAFALGWLLLTAPQTNTMHADVQRLFTWSPTFVIADDWWAQRPLLLFGRGHPPFRLFRVLPMPKGGSSPDYDERTAFLLLAENPNIDYLIAEGRPSFSFMSSGRSYTAIGPVTRP